MHTRPLQARYTPLELPASVESLDSTVAIPVSRGLQQRFFFFNLRTRKGMLVEYPKRPGLRTLDGLGFVYHFATFVRNPRHKVLGRVRTLFQKYHNGISALEVLFKLSKPHGITHLGGQRYLVSLWSSSNYLLIDLRNRTMEAHTLADPSGPLTAKPRQEIFSTYQHFDEKTKTTYFTTRGRDTGKDSPDHNPLTRAKAYDWNTGELRELWCGRFGQPTHYVALSPDGRRLGMVQFGDVYDDKGSLLPSTILVLDLATGAEHWIDNSGWSPSAHIDWDPVEPDVCYLSCHNGLITPVDSPVRFLRDKVYKWKLFGPASVHKYRVNRHGPEKLGVFTHPDIFRLTIHKVFVHRGRKVVVTTGFPDLVFFADADSMEFVSRVRLSEPGGRDTVLGSLFPSPDGEKVFAITTGSFQVVDVADARVDSVVPLGRIHDPFNHMISVSDTSW